jgi:hypothetical protein
LDDLLQNAGPAFQRTISSDEALLERLRLLGTEQLTDVDVKAKCQSCYRGWAAAYKKIPGMEPICALYKQLPQRKKQIKPQDSKAIRETERLDDDEEEEAQRKASIAAENALTSERRRSSAAEFHAASSSMLFAPASYQPQRGGSVVPGPLFGSKKDKKDKDKDKKKGKKVAAFNFGREKGEINNVMTHANIESVGLVNALKLINKEKERVSDNPEAKRRFEICKQLRKRTYRYCQCVEDERYLGALLSANDQLSDVLILYEQLDKSFDYDSDSEDYEDPDLKTASPKATKEHASMPPMAGLSLQDKPAPKMPERPTFTTPFAPAPAVSFGSKGNTDKQAALEEDEEDPFGDSNAIATPANEITGMTW